MILGSLRDAGEYAGTIQGQTFAGGAYGANPGIAASLPGPAALRAAYPITAAGGPLFNVGTNMAKGSYSRWVVQNEQSQTPTAVGISLGELIKGIFARAFGAADNAAAIAANPAPAVIAGGGALTPGSARSKALALAPTPAAIGMQGTIGPGLTPPSPFVWGSRAGVPVPVGVRGLPSAGVVAGSVTVRGNPRASQILWGE